MKKVIDTGLNGLNFINLRFGYKPFNHTDLNQMQGCETWKKIDWKRVDYWSYSS